MCEIYKYFIEHPSIIVNALLIIIGWIIVHFLSKLRDLKNKRKEMKLSFLVDAYRQLEKSYASDDKDSIREAFAYIQLLGSSEHIKLIKEIGEEVNAGQIYNPEKLLLRMRKDLRKELGLKKINENLLYLRKKNITCKTTHIEKFLDAMTNPADLECLKGTENKP